MNRDAPGRVVPPTRISGGSPMSLMRTLAKVALGAVVALQSLALLAWGWWLVAEIRADSVRAKEKKNK